MKSNRKILIAIVTFVFVILLAACENSSNESSAKLDNQSQNNNSSQDTNDDSSNVDSTESASKTSETDINNVNEKEDTSNNVSEKEENPSTDNTTESLKEAYLEKLNNTKIEAEELEPTDSSTFALKKVENDRWDLWDGLLNEIYGVLKEQLLPNEMNQLREEQRNWIQYRDDQALEASLKYKGGTQEHLEYVSVLANLTEERCYELVADYMK
ncbi:lysozyme inhibitor LprI family protein [Oceanobacillus longus]|uniref:Lysozyme inhibitor LprI family protein n=1 Tax=Oceanobacillus longus TaxID=930120 RepID=A0ABV8H0D3_9BACI